MTAATPSRAVAAGLVGTALLVATVVGPSIMAERPAGGNDGIALLGNTAATGAILYVLVTIFGPVSGAHFNPAVTLAFALRREIGPGKAARFAIAQVAGAVLGTFVAHLMFELPVFQAAATLRQGPAQWLSEGVATFSLVLAILGTLRTRPEAVPAAVGLVITAGYWFTASTSFADPAVTIGRALSDTFAGISPADVPAFILAQVCGAVAALVLASRLFGWKAARPA